MSFVLVTRTSHCPGFSGVTRCLSEEGQTFLKEAHWPPFGNAIISSQKLTYIAYIWPLIFACLPQIHVGVSLHAHPVRSESHIQRHAN